MGDSALPASLAEAVARAIREFARGVPDISIAGINHGLVWDTAHENGYTPKTKSPQKYRQIRAGLVGMRDQLAAAWGAKV